MNKPVAVTTDLRRQFRDVLVDGKRLETMWIQPNAAASETIVMLHEGLGSIALWKDFPHRLAARTGCRVLVYSRYGHGNSAKLTEKRPVDFMHHEGEVVLPQLLDKLDIEQPILLGHSDGGSIALIFAGRYPGRVRALILEAPHVFVEDLSVTSIAAAKVAYLTTNFRNKLGIYHDDVDATFWGWNDIWLEPRFRSWNIEHYLETISCPVLCIQGEQDEYGTPAQVKAIAANIAGSQVIMLPNCAHSPHLDQRDATLETMAEFVASIAGSASRL